ncbi:tumor necrosis factor receptor superfamily member 5-like isoform X2 [Hemibagrus wyckioides]|uniref:tumor necrosis factor receptor superfamily member 5-like isoform X2 n=1 Tax=Hemibagrus wyckioides TaxID=337641 RepID=UPI00266D17B2|nr:tumor necrosis factor receptor superfamily member 5-like isoform X2 [Hemibagrus wyckioides]
MISTFLTRLYIFGTCAALTFGSKCGQSEYSSAAEECCPMCAIGSVVLKDCHGDYSTTCKPCSKGTFMNEPNGLLTCFQCKICENGTKSSDTVCEPCLSGFYSPEGVNCSKWTDCSVKNEIEEQEGTSIKDVQCKPRNWNMRYGLIAALLTVTVPLLLSLIVLYLKQNHKIL